MRRRTALDLASHVRAAPPAGRQTARLPLRSLRRTRRQRAASGCFSADLTRSIQRRRFSPLLQAPARHKPGIEQHQRRALWPPLRETASYLQNRAAGKPRGTGCRRGVAVPATW